MTEKAIQSALHASPLFAGCEMEEMAPVVRSFRAGQMVSDRPDGVPSVGLLASGRVEVYSVALDGRDVQLSVLETGECFGICNLLVEADLETVLRCTEESVILFLEKERLVSLLERDGAMALRFAALCNRKIQFLLRRIEQLTMQSCRGKVIAWVLAQHSDTERVRLPGSREAWARHLGVSRAALFRELAALQEQGALAVRGSELEVLDADLLERLLYRE